MERKLDRHAVQAWLRGQQRAQAHMARERTLRLLQLSTRQALQVYLDLCTSSSRQPRLQPSPVLWAMRRAVARKERSKLAR